MQHLYTYDNGVFCYGTNCAIDNNGNVVPLPKGITQAPKLAATTAAQNPQIKIITTQQFKAMQNPNTPRPTYQYAEDNSKKMELVRTEKPSDNGLGITVSLVIDATLSVANPVLVLGDGGDNIALQLGIPALPVGTVIGGDYGANTLDFINKRVKAGQNIRLVNLQESASNASVFANVTGVGVLGGTPLAYASFTFGQSQPSVSPIFYNKGVGVQAFNLLDRSLDTDASGKRIFDYTLSVETALIKRVPTGQTTTMTFEIYSMGGIVQDMVKQS